MRVDEEIKQEKNLKKKGKKERWKYRQWERGRERRRMDKWCDRRRTEAIQTHACLR